MAIKSILRMGNPGLQQVAAKVTEFNTPQLQQLITDLFDTLQVVKGAGLAAPQIGVPLQVTVFGFQKSERYPFADPIPRTVLINPKIEIVDEIMNDDWEGCLSTENIRGLVPRYTSIRYSGYDEQGQFFQREVSGFHARIVQHEVDHLHGKLFPSHIQNFNCFGFKEELEKLMKETGSKLA